MANKRQKESTLMTDDVITIIAERAKFAKKDVEAILDEMKILFAECIEKDIDIAIKGLIHVKVSDFTFTRQPGIVKHHGNKDFNKVAKKIKYQVPENFRNLVRAQVKEKNIESIK